ncbi:MAG: hypothetical protein HYS83_01135 [Candidatus Blackburnbacteria bacterium]|nr:hypothetical protein [Candidatus Blackburnbacteria bacterium]
MPHVSRKPISKDLYIQITQELWWLLTNIKDEKEMTVFLGDLLTETEKVMLAKRLALANLILKGWDWKEICFHLTVSSATVNQMKRWLAGGGKGFKSALKRLERKERWREFWDQFDEILSSVPKTREDLSGLMHGKIPKGR